MKVWSDLKNEVLTFHIWNSKMIDEQIALRIFQRNFSTKEETGRGIGAYAMKLLGEKVLGGQVSFTTSTDGTIFRLH